MADAPAQIPHAVPGLMQQAADPLAQLRDIHAPGMIETWPPAPGWWVLALLALALVLFAASRLLRRWLDNRYRREAMAELTQIKTDWRRHGNDQTYLEALQKLMKRVALTRFPREQVAGLTGEAWVRFLDQSTGSHDFSMAESEALIDGAYREDISIDINSIEAAAGSWIEKHDARFLREAAR